MVMPASVSQALAKARDVGLGLGLATSGLGLGLGLATSGLGLVGSAL